MIETSFTSTIVFLAIIAFVALMVAAFMRRAGYRASTIAVLWGGWIVATGALPFLMVGLPPNAQFLGFLPILITVPLVIFLPMGRRLALALPLWLLAAVQVFRLPLELVLDAWYKQGVMPIQMTYHGDNLDILIGALALPVGVLIYKGWGMRPVAWGFNILGTLFLVRIVGIVMLSSPTPLRAAFGGYETGPDVLLGISFPHIWIGSIAVFSAFVIHGVSLRQLWVTRKDQPIG